MYRQLGEALRGDLVLIGSSDDTQVWETDKALVRGQAMQGGLLLGVGRKERRGVEGAIHPCFS